MSTNITLLTSLWTILESLRVKYVSVNVLSLIQEAESRGVKKANICGSQTLKTPISAQNSRCRTRKRELLLRNSMKRRKKIEDVYKHTVATDSCNRFSIRQLQLLQRTKYIEKRAQAPSCGPIRKSRLGAWRSVRYECPLPCIDT